MNAMTDLDLGYLAGYIDGEGYIGIVKTAAGLPAPRLAVGSTNLKVLEWLKVYFNGNIAHQRDAGENVQESWSWYNTNKEELIEILALIIPVLREKKDQAKLLMQFCKDFSHRKQKMVMLDEEITRANGYLHLMTELNATGTGAAIRKYKAHEFLKGQL